MKNPYPILETLLALAATDEGRQRIREMVAEGCGWIKLETPEPLLWKRDGITHLLGHATWRDSSTSLATEVELPRYTGSLDAMAMAEESLQDDQRALYAYLLMFLAKRQAPEDVYWAMSSPAVNRAVAWLTVRQCHPMLPKQGEELS
jgi:hypothetical protein